VKNSIDFSVSTKFSKYSSSYVTKIILTRCQIFHLKFTKFNFGWGSAPDPAGGAHSAPHRSLTGFEKGREKGGGNGGEGKRRGEKGRGNEEEENGDSWSLGGSTPLLTVLFDFLLQ